MMKNTDKLKRAIAFYISVALFIILLPIILSYSLGYKIDYKEFRIYKTGILFVNSHPAGATVYINGKEHNELTPTQIEELKPGRYRIEVKRERFYSWERDIIISPNMVRKLDRIVLFPLAQEMKKIGLAQTLGFAISDKKNIYYFTKEGLFKSNMDGTIFKRLSLHSRWPGKIMGKKFSPDGNMLLYFDERNLWMIYFNQDKNSDQSGAGARIEEILTDTDPIVDVFWYSTPNYIVVVTENEIKVAELRGGDKRNVVSLYTFNMTPEHLYYDDDNDSLFFLDRRDEGSSSKEKSYIYRLDLRERFFDSLTRRLLKKEPEANNGKR